MKGTLRPARSDGREGGRLAQIHDIGGERERSVIAELLNSAIMLPRETIVGGIFVRARSDEVAGGPAEDIDDLDDSE